MLHIDLLFLLGESAPPMKVTIIGSGYVGLVTGACLAEVGNEVLCVDIDQRKNAMLNEGRIPIYAPGLDNLVQKNAKAGRLAFSTDIAAGVAHGLFQFIAVGTPPDEDGSADRARGRGGAGGGGGRGSEY